MLHLSDDALLGPLRDGRRGRAGAHDGRRALLDHENLVRQEKLVSLQGPAEEWSLGCVNSCLAARASQEVGFTQPRDQSFA